MADVTTGHSVLSVGALPAGMHGSMVIREFVHIDVAPDTRWYALTFN